MDEYNKLIWPIRMSCGVFGCWPSDQDDDDVSTLGILRERVHQLLSLIVLIVVTGGASLEAFKLWGVDMNETIECSLVSSAFYMSVLRIIVFTTYSKEFKFIIREMRRDWTQASDLERDCLRKKTLVTFKFAKLFITNTFLAGSTFVVMPLLDMMMLSEGENIRTILPFRGYYFFDHTTSPRFQVMYVINSCMGLVGVSTITGATSFSLVATMHAAAKFYIIQRDFKDVSNWNSKEKIGKVIRRHQECITYAENVEKVVNFLALGQFVVSSGLLCFAGFQLTTMLEDSTRLTKYALFMNAATMELFIFSYSGQNLKTESEKIADFVYSSSWIGSLTSSSIQLVMMRALKPCTITAGKFYDVTLESFLKVISSSFSYFTVLLTMQEGK